MAVHNAVFTMEEEEGSGAVLRPPDENLDMGPSEATTELAEARKSDLQINRLIYSIQDSPPWQTCVVLGLQHYLTMVGGTVVVPFMLTRSLCIEGENPVRGMFFSTIIFVSGLITLLQTIVGIRLPVVQGGTLMSLILAVAMLDNSFGPCSNYDLQAMTEDEKKVLWQTRIREIQGAIMASSLVHIALGFTGLVGLLLNFIGPLTIMPTITLVGLGLLQLASEKMAEDWIISITTVVLLSVVSQYLQDVPVILPGYRRRGGLFKIRQYPFKTYPVLICILLAWFLCFLLTFFDVFQPGSPSRTDRTKDLLRNSPWFRIPYPFQWGFPTVSAAGVVALTAAVATSVVESVGDYHACATISGAPSPPEHAINRGIAVEGFGSLLAGIWGTGDATTSYSENIGVIAITKVGSLRVVQASAAIMLVCGVCGKFCALFSTIPEPVVWGAFSVLFAIIAGIGLSSLQYVDMNSARNLFVIGVSLFFGLMIPAWMKENPSSINTSSKPFNEMASTLLQASMFVGGLLGFLLDNIIPGTPEERGLTRWRGTQETPLADSAPAALYDLPFAMEYFRRQKWTSKCPVSPTFPGWKPTWNSFASKFLSK